MTLTSEVCAVFFRRRLACSFCGRSAAQVSKLVTGRKAYICDLCAAEVQRIMSASDSGAHQSAQAAPSARVLSWLRAQTKRAARVLLAVGGPERDSRPVALLEGNIAR